MHAKSVPSKIKIHLDFKKFKKKKKKLHFDVPVDNTDFSKRKEVYNQR